MSAPSTPILAPIPRSIGATTIERLQNASEELRSISPPLSPPPSPPPSRPSSVANDAPIPQSFRKRPRSYSEPEPTRNGKFRRLTHATQLRAIDEDACQPSGCVVSRHCSPRCPMYTPPDLEAIRRKLLDNRNMPPPPFPDSEWNMLIAGLPVNLDNVLYFLRVPDYFSAPVSGNGFAAQVRTSAHWESAWRMTGSATAYLYPHRRAELVRYADYIGHLFSLFAPDFHEYVIEYDKEVRRLYADAPSFYGALPGIANRMYDGSRPGNVWWGLWQKHFSAIPRTPVLERFSGVCRRWNEGRCMVSPKACRYFHVCSRCRSGTHRKIHCIAVVPRPGQH